VSHVFISYARSTAGQAQQVAAVLRDLGYDVWLDDAIPAHRAYAEVIEERLCEARAVVVIWSAEAAKSQWVRSEADRSHRGGAEARRAERLTTNLREFVRVEPDSTALRALINFDRYCE
jgi:TIR domain